jgi:hypothetical protein
MKGKTSYQALYISIGIATFFLVLGMALGGVLNGESAWSFLKLSPRLAVVDMQALVAKGSQHLATTSSNKVPGKGSAKVSNQVSNHEIWQAGEQLKETLEAFALKHRLILLAKGAVMGGSLPDHTAEIIEDAFPDYTASLTAFTKNRTANEQPKSFQPEGFQPEDFNFESLKLKGQGPENKGPMGQENQP